MSYVIHEGMFTMVVFYHPDKTHEITIQWSKGTNAKTFRATWDNDGLVFGSLEARVIGDCLGLFTKGGTEFYCDQAPASLLELLK